MPTLYLSDAEIQALSVCVDGAAHHLRVHYEEDVDPDLAKDVETACDAIGKMHRAQTKKRNKVI